MKYTHKFIRKYAARILTQCGYVVAQDDQAPQPGEVWLEFYSLYGGWNIVTLAGNNRGHNNLNRGGRMSSKEFMAFLGGMELMADKAEHENKRQPREFYERGGYDHSDVTPAVAREAREG